MIGATMPTLPSGRTLAMSPRRYEPDAKAIPGALSCLGLEYRGICKHVVAVRSEGGRK